MLRWISFLMVICEHIVQIAWICFCVFLMRLHLFPRSVNLLAKPLQHMILQGIFYMSWSKLLHVLVLSHLCSSIPVRLGLMSSLFQELWDVLSHSPYLKEQSAEYLFIPGWHSANELWKTKELWITDLP